MGNPAIKSLKICNPLCCCTSNSPLDLTKKKQRKKLPKRRKETRSISDYLCKWPVMINQKINNINVKLAKFWSFLNVLKTVRLPLELAPYFNYTFFPQEMEYYLMEHPFAVFLHEYFTL